MGGQREERRVEKKRVSAHDSLREDQPASDGREDWYRCMNGEIADDSNE